VAPLEEGFHRLPVRGCTGAALDMLVLARDSSSRR
jgi:hypothetical protein